MKVSRQRAKELGIPVPERKARAGRAATSGPNDPMSVAVSQVLAYCRSKGYPADPIPEHAFHPVREWRFDWCWIEHRLALEIEGLGDGLGGRHQRRDGFREDALKYSTASIMGWRLIRVTYAMIADGTVYDLLDLAFSPKGGG